MLLLVVVILLFVDGGASSICSVDGLLLELLHECLASSMPGSRCVVLDFGQVQLEAQLWRFRFLDKTHSGG